MSRLESYLIGLTQGVLIAVIALRMLGWGP